MISPHTERQAISWPAISPKEPEASHSNTEDGDNYLMGEFSHKRREADGRGGKESHPASDAYVKTGDTLANDKTWEKYVRAPKKIVTPKGVVSGSVTGQVSQPDGLINGGTPTILSRHKSKDEIPSLVVDFGQNLAGYLNLRLKGSTDSTTALPGIRLAFSETLQYLTDRSDFTRSDNAEGNDKRNKLVYNGTDQIAVEPKLYTWTNKLGCQIGDKVCADGLHGFRYVKIWLEALPRDAPHTTSFGQVEIHSITLTYSGFLGTPNTFTGWFECSDTDVSQWWYDGVYTNDICTDIFRKEDVEPRQAFSPSLDQKVVLHDGAKRDRDPYVGDLAVSALTLYLSHEISPAARNVLADLAEHQRDDGWIPPASIRNYTLPLFDYPLWWVVCSYNHVLHTGDTAYLEKYYPNMANTLDTFYPRFTDVDNNLLTKPGGYGDYAFLPREGAVTYYNALYVLALSHAADLATHLGDGTTAERWRKRGETISTSLLERNWDRKANAFFDGSTTPDGELCATHPQDGNALAILAGVAGGADAESIFEYLDDTCGRPYGNAFFDNDKLGAGFSERVYAFISYFELAARFLSRSEKTAFDQLRRLYGHMASNDPGITMWEGIGAGGVPYEGAFTSMAHGWSTGVVPLLTQYVLGVKPTGIGYKTWSVRPVRERGGVEWAKGIVPTPRGGIEVSWEVKGGRFEMNVCAPAGTEGEVSVPVGGEERSVHVDGVVGYSKVDEIAEFGARDDGAYVVFPFKGGEHHTFGAKAVDDFP